MLFEIAWKARGVSGARARVMCCLAVASVVCVPLFREILKKPGADGMKICTFCHQNEVRENPNYKVYVCTVGRRNGGEVKI